MSKRKAWQLLGTVAVMALFLTACSTAEIVPGYQAESLWDYIVLPLSNFIVYLGDFTGNYGWGVIIATVIIRIVLVPLDIWTQKSQQGMQKVQPLIKEIQEKYKDSTDPQAQQKQQYELMQVMQQNGVNPLGGCLSSIVMLLVQMPILMAFYQAIIRTPVLKTGTFYYLELGNPDPYYILPIVATALMLGSTLLMMPKDQRSPKNNPMALSMYLMPVMFLFVMLNLPSALSLYLFTGNLFMLVRQLIFKFVLRKN